ncbi:MAG: hypothetical protein ACREM2_08525 [Vulcanimicrobiaceae bacterium]
MATIEQVGPRKFVIDGSFVAKFGYGAPMQPGDIRVEANFVIAQLRQSGIGGWTNVAVYRPSGAAGAWRVWTPERVPVWTSGDGRVLHVEQMAFNLPGVLTSASQLDSAIAVCTRENPYNEPIVRYPPSNVFMYASDGSRRWQIQNPPRWAYPPPQYYAVGLADDGRFIAPMFGAPWTSVVDPSTGVVVELLPAK